MLTGSTWSKINPQNSDGYIGLLSGCSVLVTQETAEDVPASVCFGAHATTTSTTENLYIAPLILACADLQCVMWVHLSLQEYITSVGAVGQ